MSELIEKIVNLSSNIEKDLEEMNTKDQASVIHSLRRLLHYVKTNAHVRLSFADDDLIVTDINHIIGAGKSSVFSILTRDDLKTYGVKYRVKNESYQLYPVVKVEEVTNKTGSKLIKATNSEGETTYVRKNEFIRAVKILYLLTNDKYSFRKAKELPMLCSKDRPLIVGKLGYIVMIAPYILD